MKILIVENVCATLQLIAAEIRHSGWTAFSVSNGEQAIAAFCSDQPDLVLLDVLLPDMDGFEVARQMRAIEKPGAWTPIIFLSSRNSDADIEKGISAGGDDYLSKPVSEAVLGAKIRAMQRIVQMRTSLVVLARELDAANQELKRLSASDGLTGIANRRFFDDYLSREWRRAMREESVISLLMCDVDHFKPFNDTFGHQAGDDCLRRIANALASTMERGADIVARYGGEEFAIILPQTPLAGAQLVAERLRHAVETLNQPNPGSPEAITTISVGLATLRPSKQNVLQELIQNADRALYRAKSLGRNVVCSYDAELDR